MISSKFDDEEALFDLYYLIMWVWIGLLYMYVPKCSIHIPFMHCTAAEIVNNLQDTRFNNVLDNNHDIIFTQIIHCSFEVHLILHKLSHFFAHIPVFFLKFTC